MMGVHRWGVRLLGLVLVTTLMACGGGSDSPTSATSTDRAATGADTTATTLNKSAFCVTIRALEALGSDTATAPSTPAAVLEQNTKLAALIERAAAAVPADAPADVQGLIADYRLLSEAIAAAGGDTAAAFDSLTTTQPGLSDRLGRADAHRASFTFFAERCGTAPPA
ncbi:MAG: hypothetical protein ABIY48_09090 [Acidimicrobiales bacterium]